MDEHLLSLLEELSLRSCSEDENSSRDSGINHSSYTSSSSPTYEQLSSSKCSEDLELKTAVESLFQDLKPSYTKQQRSVNREDYDKTKLLVALLGNIDLVTCAVKKLSHLVSLGKKMEQIYRSYYMDPTIQLNMAEIDHLTTAFQNIYNSENYIREVNISRIYQAYCKKLIDIYNSRTSEHSHYINEDRMIS